jgi:isopentenyldiphosphate isomerase
MKDEYSDIVNEEDQIIGRGTRDKIHQDYLIHRGVHVLVLNSQGEILVQKRSIKKDYYPGFFDASVGAQVLSGESYEEAAIRETKEELGFKPPKLKMVVDYKSYSPRQRENRRLFICHFEGPFKIDKEELEFVRFYSTEKIQQEIKKEKMKFTEGFMISFSEYLKAIKKIQGKPLR